MIEFLFQGTVHKCPQCTEGVPHIPAVLGLYKTQNWDWCQNFCTGIEGDLGGGSKLVINADPPSEESAETPAFYRGQAYIQD